MHTITLDEKQMKLLLSALYQTEQTCQNFAIQSTNIDSQIFWEKASNEYSKLSELIKTESGKNE
jgi:hypothetical protein